MGVSVVASHLRDEWCNVGHGLDSKISLAEFQTLLVEPSIALFLNDVGVDMLVLVDMAEMLYEDITKEDYGLSFAHFVDAVLNMRGTNPVTVQDVKSQLRIMKRMIKDSVVQLEKDIVKQFKECMKEVKTVQRLVLGEEVVLGEEEEPDDEMCLGEELGGEVVLASDSDEMHLGA